MTEGAKRLGQGDPCPHCQATSGVSPDGDGFICLVCGGPRIVVEGAIERAHGEAELLRRAKHLGSRRLAWAVGGGVMTAMAVLSLLIATLLLWATDLGALGAGLVLAAASIPALVAVTSFRKAGSLSAEARDAIEQAWRRAALEVLRARGAAVEPAELAQTLHVSEDRAIQLLAHAQVEGLLDDAPARAPRLRVQGQSPVAEPEVSFDDSEHEPARSKR